MGLCKTQSQQVSDESSSLLHQPQPQDQDPHPPPHPHQPLSGWQETEHPYVHHPVWVASAVSHVSVPFISPSQQYCNSTL